MSTSWPCVNKCTSSVTKKKKKDIKWRAPWNIQGYTHSLTFSESECSHFFILTLSSSFWPSLSPIIPSATMWFCCPESSSLSTTHKPSFVWKRYSPQLLFRFFSLNTQTSSYFLIIFSVLNLWDVSSCHNSNGTVFWSATNDLIINKQKSLFLRHHYGWPFEISGSDDHFLLKVILVTSSEDSIILIFPLFPCLFVSLDPSSSLYFRTLFRLVSGLLSEISHHSKSLNPQSFWFSNSNPSIVPGQALLPYILHFWVFISALRQARIGPVVSIQCHPLFQDLVKKWPSLPIIPFLTFPEQTCPAYSTGLIILYCELGNVILLSCWNFVLPCVCFFNNLI